MSVAEKENENGYPKLYPHEKPTESPLTQQVTDSPSSNEKPSHEHIDQLRPTPSRPEVVDPREIYLNWQFVTVFVSISLGFYAAWLASSILWNSLFSWLVIAPAVGPVKTVLSDTVMPLYNDPRTTLSGYNWPEALNGVNLSAILWGINARRLLAGFEIPAISSGLNESGISENVNVLKVTAGINFTRVAAGINLSSSDQGLSSLKQRDFRSELSIPDLSKLNLTGLSSSNLSSLLDLNPSNFSNTNLTHIASGLNLTQIGLGLNMTGIEENVDLAKVVSGLDLIQIASALNVTRIASGISLSHITSSLNLTSDIAVIQKGVSGVKQALWAFATLLSTQVVSSILCGRLSDYVGRRWIFLIGNLLSLVGFVTFSQVQYGIRQAGLCALIGAGTGIQILGPWLALAELVPIDHRFVVTGACVSLFAPLMMIHPAIAQAFIQSTAESWRWPYYINAIFSFLALVGLYISYHPPTYRQLHNHPTDDPPPKDWLGLVVLTVSASLLSYVMQWGKLIYAWNSVQCILVTIFSGGALVGFIGYARHFGGDRAAYPAYLMRTWDHTSQFLFGVLVSLIRGFIPLAQIVIFISVCPELPMQSSWDQTSSIGIASGFILGAALLVRPKNLKWQLFAAVVVQMTFISATPIARPTRHRTLLALFFLTNLGQGYATVITYVTAPMTAHKKDMGLIVGLLSAFQNLGFTILRALFFVIFTGHIIGKVQHGLIPSILADINAENPLPSLVMAIRSTSHYSTLLSVPFLQRSLHTFLWDIGSQSYRFILLLGTMYFIITIFVVLFGPHTDGYLSKKVWVCLNRGGIFRLPTRMHKPHHWQV